MVNGWETMATSLVQAFGSEFVADFCRTLQDHQRAEEEMAYSSQRRIAAATERLEQSWMEGLGECHMRLDPEVYYHWARKEPGCWTDKTFIAEFKRDNKDVIVKSKARKATILRP